MDFFKILNGGIGVSMSNFDRLWAKKYSGWPETELTGLLPLSFLSKGEALTDYRIYGTANGAGVATENKINVSMFTLGYTLDGTTGLPIVSQNRATTLTPIAISSSNAVIKCSYSGEGTFLFMYSVLNGNTLVRRAYSPDNPYLIDTSGGDTLYICVFMAGGTAVDLSKISNLMLTEGSTAPTSYIPYGYKIPISNTSGEQQSNYDLFIGDTQLGEEEYLDFGEQKVYKLPNIFDGTVSKWPSLGASVTITDNGDDSYTINNQGNANYPAIQLMGALTQGKTYRVSITISGLTTQMITQNHISLGMRNIRTDVFVSGTNKKITSDGKWTTNFVSVTDSETAFCLIFSYDNIQFSNVIISDISIVEVEPTDPPAPLPAINTYNGENTLSSEETVGEVTIKGRIKETT